MMNHGETPLKSKRKVAEVNESIEAYLRPHGFEGGEPIHEFTNCFRVKEAFAALTGSTYSNPIPVYLTSEEDDVTVPVIVTLAKACYQPFAPHLDTPTGCHNTPGWYFEGWIPRSGFDSYHGITRVRVYVTERNVDSVDGHVEVLWQVIPTDPDPDEPLSLA